jgi:hypothetical protein
MTRGIPGQGAKKGNEELFMADSFAAQTIIQEALKQLLKRMKNPVDKDTYNDHRQYNGKDHLFGIKFFHG